MWLGDPAAVTYDKLKSVFRGQSYSRVTVFYLHKEYKSGRLQVGDKDRTGQPLKSRTAAKIQECDCLVRRNCQVGIIHLSKTLGISYGSVFGILHKDLLLKKRASKLVPHVLTPAQKRDRIQFCVNFLDKFPSDCAL